MTWSSLTPEDDDTFASLGRHPGLEYEETPENSSASDDGESCNEEDNNNDNKSSSLSANNVKLFLVFCVMVLSGAGQAVFVKLQTIPMFNYPNFINLYGSFLYIPLMFAYIIPVYKYGWLNNAISAEQWAMSRRPFAIMGCLDCLACMMQVFSSFYLPGPLLILLPQAAIPISMFLSKQILGQRYRLVQYIGAVVVLGGILVVLEPLVTHRHSPHNICQAIDLEEDCTICQVETTQEDCLSHLFPLAPEGNSIAEEFTAYVAALGDNNNNTSSDGEPICEWVATQSASTRQEELLLVWSLVSILSCIPMALSSIYKEIALGQEGMELDPIFLNGWVAVFQFFFSVMLAVPAGMTTSPPVEPMDLPRNIYNGLKCYLGRGSVETGCHPDDMCASHAFLLVNLCLGISVVYTLSYTLILKYGSANLLYLASTATIPIGNFAFALPFLPQSTIFHFSDVLGLIVIIAGIVFYRFGDSLKDDKDDAVEPHRQEEDDIGTETLRENSLRDPLLEGGQL